MAIKELSSSPVSIVEDARFLPHIVEKVPTEPLVPLHVLYDRSGKVNEETAQFVAELITLGKPVVGDFITTYGLMGNEDARLAIAQAKKEDLTKLKPMSMVAHLEDSMNWIDFDAVHPEFRDEKKVKKLGEMLTNLGFLRFPVNEAGKNLSQHPYHIDGEQIQVLFKENPDPILKNLSRMKPGKNFYLVTSLNPHGELERFQPHTALEFAKQIKASAFVLQREEFFPVLQSGASIYEDSREKRGSVPIIQLPRVTDRNYYTGAPIITILRAANTHAYSIERMLKEVFPNVGVRYAPSSHENAMRPQYSLPSEARKELRTILYQASFSQ